MIHAIHTWSKLSQLNFNISKCTYNSFKFKFISTYSLSDTAISSSNFQKDLGIIVSNNLILVNPYNHIISCAYKILGLIRRSFSSSLKSSVKMKLYLTLVRSQPMYCTLIWCPYLLKDVQNMERILVINLNIFLIPIIQPDTCSFIDCLDFGMPSPLLTYISLLQLSKLNFKKYFWNHFESNFDDNDSCSFLLLYPHCKCNNSLPPMNFNSLYTTFDTSDQGI